MMIMRGLNRTVMEIFIPLFCALLLWLAPAAPASAEVSRFQVPLEGSPSLGPPDAPITIIEFIDYQ